MVHSTVFFQKLRRAIADIVRVRKAEVDQKRIGVLNQFAFVQVIKHALGVPGASGLGSAAAFGGIMYHRKLFVGIVVTVAAFAGAHGFVAGPVEHRCQRVLDQIGRHQFRVQRIRIGRWLAEFPIGNVPDCAPTHDHVPGGGTHAAHPRPHMIRAVDHHPFSRQFFNHRRV